MDSYTVTYLGKPGKPATERLPVPGIPMPFEAGENRTFDDAAFLALGVDPKDGEQFIQEVFGQQNQNRPEDQALFVWRKGKKPVPDTQVQATDPTDTVSTGSAGSVDVLPVPPEAGMAASADRYEGAD